MGAGGWVVGGTSVGAVSRDNVSLRFTSLCLAHSVDGNGSFSTRTIYCVRAPCWARWAQSHVIITPTPRLKLLGSSIFTERKLSHREFQPLSQDHAVVEMKAEVNHGRLNS